MKKVILSFIFAFISSASAQSCKEFLQSSTNQQNLSSTESLIAYLSELINTQVISTEYLTTLIHNLEQKHPIPNPFSAIHTKSEQNIHRESLQLYIEQNNFDYEHLLSWAKEFVKNKENIRKNRKRTEDETLFPYTKMIFYDIKPGSYQRGKEAVHTVLTQSFAMMNTPITQFMWARINILFNDLTNINPSFFKSGREMATIIIDDIPVQMQPDHPVDSVSPTEAQKFADQLTKLSNNPDPSIQKVLVALIPEHRFGDLYDLPTDAQWEFVMRNRGTLNGDYFDRNDPEEVKEYAWYQENSDERTHSVAEKPPRIIDGHPFYDLEGNVTEWTKGYYTSEIKPGIDPIENEESEFRNMRGGCWQTPVHLLESKLRSAPTHEYKTSCLGMRLVRYRK